MMKRYSHHTFSVQSPHTMDAILFRDVKKRNSGYRPLIQSCYGPMTFPFSQPMTLWKCAVSKCMQITCRH